MKTIFSKSTPEQGLTILAFTGLLLGLLIMFWPCNHNSVFHEVAYDPWRVSDSLLKTFPRPDTSCRRYNPDSAQPDAAIMKAWPRRQDSCYRLSKAQYEIDHISGNAGYQAIANNLFFRRDGFNMDSFEVLNHQIDTCLCSKYPVGGIRLKWSYVLPSDPAVARPPVVLDTFLKLPVAHPGYIQFFARYPGFAMWTLLMLVQFGLYFAFVFLSGHLLFVRMQKLNCTITGADDRGYGPLFINFGIAAFIAGVLMIVVYRTFFDQKVITGAVFYSRISFVSVCLGILGYLSAVFCFAIYLSVSGFRMRLMRKAVGLTAANVSDALDKLSRIFQTANFVTATVLSLSVLSLGVMFSSIHELAFYKKLIADIGFDPFRNEFVYLYGALHSILLFIFFLPARINLQRLKKENPSPASSVPGAAAADDSNTIADLGKMLGTIGMTFLPLLTGAFQQMISLLIK
jgi:hypothetical protein